MSFYSRGHYRRVCPPPDRPQDIADRIARNRAAELAALDREREFPDITRANFDDALRYQEERYHFHLQSFPCQVEARA